MVQQQTVDVVVCGAGMAGLCASPTALQAGARVLTLEKGSRAGGSMLLSGGLIWTFADKAQLHEEISQGNVLLQDMVVDGLHDGLAWLEAQGVPLREEQRFMWYGRGRSVAPGDLMAVLLDRIDALGGTVLYETAIESLLLDNDAIRGVRAIGPAGPVAIDASAVVLATGGFQGNVELLTRYVTPYADKLYLRANPWSTGDGFLAAIAIGAAITPSLAAFYGHALAAPPAQFTHREFLDMTQRYGPIAVALNLDSARFADESAGTGEETLNLAIASQRDATAVYVLDAAIAEVSHHGGALPRVTIERARARGAPVIERDSLEALCDALASWGVPAKPALSTLNGYNEALRGGRKQSLHPSRRGNQYLLTQPPFTAVLVRAAITFACGGLAVDPEMRVLRRAASTSTLALAFAAPTELRMDAIAALFAAGCDIGDVSNRGYMGGLATALTTDRIAGQGAARRCAGTMSA